MQINPKTLKVEIDLIEMLEPDFESKLKSVGNNIANAISTIFTGIKDFKQEFEESQQYKKAFQEFCENKFNQK